VKHVRPAVVAFVSTGVRRKASEPAPDLPRIVGTGFFVDPRGIVATNRHVVAAMLEESRIPDNQWAFKAWIIPPTTRAKNGDLEAKFSLVDVVRLDPLTDFNAGEGLWFGEDIPDVAFVQVRLQDTPFLALSDDHNDCLPGTSVATVGFPTGNHLLLRNGKGRTAQYGPSVRAGIISGVQPIPELPHRLVLDMEQQGGWSGSPIFLSDRPTVVGLLREVFPNFNSTLAVPSHIVKYALEHYLENVDIPSDDYPTIEEQLSTGTLADLPMRPVVIEDD